MHRIQCHIGPWAYFSARVAENIIVYSTLLVEGRSERFIPSFLVALLYSKYFSLDPSDSPGSILGSGGVPSPCMEERGELVSGYSL